jgi:molybdate transport system substrate-binding protein
MHHRLTDEGGDRVKARQLVLAALAMLTCNWTLAANITVVSTVGVRGMLEQARESFERLGANHLIVQYGTSAVLERQLQEGRSFDVAILTRSMIDDLANRQKIVGTTSATIAKAGMGLAVQAGAVKPSIGTPDALRNALLASSGIAYTKDGQSGAAAARLFELLGITATLTGRIHQDTRPAGGVLAVAEGKTTLGLALMSEIVADPRVELVGPLPGDLQAYVVFAVGMASATKERQACRAFIAFLGTPEVRRKLRNLGMEGG